MSAKIRSRLPQIHREGMGDFKARVDGRCERIPVVAGSGEFYDNFEVTDPLCSLFRGDIPAFVQQNGGPFMVEQYRCTHDEDFIPQFIISDKRFMLALNNGTDPSEARFEFSQRVEFDPLWVWSPSTHKLLPEAGRRRAVLLCLILYRMGLNKLCSLRILRFCNLDDLRPMGFTLLHSMATPVKSANLSDTSRMFFFLS